MLTSAVFTIAPQKTTLLPAHMGRAVYSYWLNYIDQVDSGYGQNLHNSDDLKPFTCSNLVGGTRVDLHTVRIDAGQPVWFRITTLSNMTANLLLQLQQESPDKILFAEDREFQVISITTDTSEHEWAGTETYEHVALHHLMNTKKPKFSFHLEFASPTTFRSKKRSWPVPMPSWVFGNLLKRWNRFGPNPMETELIQIIESNVVLTKYTLRTKAIPLKKSVHMGCVGKATYKFLPPTKLPYSSYYSQLLNILCDYAFYAGVGYQTTVGLGQSRSID